jgi:diguanylate cyclase (GGDEF)-like protein/PAS domain S-box-containing protein
MGRLLGGGLTAEEGLGTRQLARIAAGLWLFSALLGMVAEVVVPAVPNSSHLSTVVIGGISILGGVGIWFVPWHRWSRRVLLWLVPLAFACIGLNITLANGNAYLYAITFLIVYVWLGLAQPSGTGLWLTPLLIIGYVVPVLALGGRDSALGLASALYVVPCCVVVGEAVAWGVARLQRSESALEESRERYMASFEEAPMGIALCSVEGTLLRVNRSYAAIFGSAPEEMRGRRLLDLIHPDDRAATRANMDSLLAGDIDSCTAEKRYLPVDRPEVWVSVSASCARDRSGRPLYVIVQIEDITERRALREQLAHAVVHDQLTGLPNRVMFMDRLESSLLRFATGGRAVALMFLDLDRFKLINDGLGHDAGDRLLQRVGERLLGSLRTGDLLARFGGDEFTVLCEVDDADEALAIARRLKAGMERPVVGSDGEQFVSLSIGIALSTPEVTAASTLLRQADVAMYRAKDSGPEHIAVYNAGDQLVTVRSLQTTNDLHRALERLEFDLHYQPFVDLHTLTLIGLEALLRWRHPVRGLLLPGEFIPAAEESGLIVPIGRWVIRETCRQAALWGARRDEAHQDRHRLNVAVNVSSQQLADPLFESILVEALEDSGLSADQLWLEITEGSILHDPEAAAARLRSLRELGVHIAIDDFGTGYSSLSYLKRLPVEILKIDRSFIDQLDHDPDDRAIVRAIMALGESLGLAVIGEGVERSSQASELSALGCNVAQGFLFGRPLPPVQIGAYPTDDLAGWVAGADLTVV